MPAENGKRKGGRVIVRALTPALLVEEAVNSVTQTSHDKLSNTY